ncbi:hypothetical protein CTA1_11949 [Colletotrichum tanaceti]|uniref:Infection structure specific protein n=1 Tax=Colletotrichum tanaceti TaxID=1306861 RepID=A0A4U6XKX3_9PEZI|nr:hypothetical protein CTA1_11949 [Colletotrichum tanaceti]
MQSKLLVAAAAAATGVAAIRDLSGTFPQNFRRGADALQARDETACLSVVAEHATLTADFPELPTALATATDVEIPQITDPCQFPSVTGSAGQLITSYSSALQSWQDAHITEIRSLWAACSDVPQISSVLNEYGDIICSTALAPITATATATATVTGETTVTKTGDATGDATGATASGEAASTTAAPAAAAPRETGLFMAAAAAAVGFVGAAML